MKIGPSRALVHQIEKCFINSRYILIIKIYQIQIGQPFVNYLAADNSSDCSSKDKY